MGDELLELLADLEHDRWSRWEVYREECVASPEAAEHEARWRVLRETPYADLPERHKESDRAEAKRTLAVIAEYKGRLGVNLDDIRRAAERLRKCQVELLEDTVDFRRSR